MFQPPPLRDWSAYPATFGVAAAALGASVACWTRTGFDPFVMDFRAWHGEPWRLIISALPHVNPLHLAFNLAWLWAFGTRIERTLGAVPVLGMCLFFAIVSSASEYMMFDGGVGLSGVVYGFFGLLWVLDRRDPRFTGSMDRATVVLMCGWFVLCCLLTAADVWRVGNAAHAGGCIIGALVGVAMTAVRRWPARLAVLLVAAATLVGATIGRPYLHLAPIGADEIASNAYWHLDAGRNESALPLLRRAIELEPKTADHWFNLGIALQRLNQDDACLEAYMKAVELKPADGSMRDAAAAMAAFMAYQRSERGMHTEAIGLYQKSIELDDRNATTWFNLGVEYQHVNLFNRASAAFKRAMELDPSEKFREALEGVEKIY